MAACYEIYVFGTGGLKAQTDVGKFFGIYGAAKSILTNLIVLTKSAAECTAGKKNSSASAKNGYEWLFAKVKPCKSNAKVGQFAAKAGTVVEALETTADLSSVHTALSRALAAILIEFVNLSCH